MSPKKWYRKLLLKLMGRPARAGSGGDGRHSAAGPSSGNPCSICGPWLPCPPDCPSPSITPITRRWRGIRSAAALFFLKQSREAGCFRNEARARWPWEIEPGELPWEPHSHGTWPMRPTRLMRSGESRTLTLGPVTVR